MGPHAALSRLPEPLKRVVKERLYPRPLTEGTVVPEWHLQAHDREWHRQGVFWSVMQFLPACPEDPRVGAQLESLERHHARLKELKARVFAVLPAEEAALQGIAARHGLSFPLLTDRGLSVSRRFAAALQIPLHPVVIPTLYLVNPERRVRLANRGYPSVEAVVRSIEALQQATRAGM
ncbi:MAG: redoxin domain-containing protein [Pseudomonadota bacterium]